MLRCQPRRTRSAQRILQSTAAPVLSPKFRSIKKAQESVAQEAALDELILMKSSNGGKKKYGDIITIVTKYKERGFNVERHHIEYRLELRNKGK
jgi:hypothetical protein